MNRGIKKTIGNVSYFYDKEEALLNYINETRPRFVFSNRSKRIDAHWFSIEENNGKFSVRDLHYCNGVVTSMVRGCLCGLTLYDAIESLIRVAGKEIFNNKIDYETI